MHLLERGVYFPHVLENDRFFISVVDHTHNIRQRFFFDDLSEMPSKLEEAKQWLAEHDPVSRAE
jgi:DNA-directed RNA polymerase delta subunit